MKIKKGDTVKVLYGKDSGKRGTVVAIDSKTRMIVVEGINVYKRHLKGDGRTRTSEIVSIEKAMPTSKVMLVCPQCDKATRVNVEKDGKNVVRICKKCGKKIEAKVEEKKEEKTKTTAAKKSTTKKSTAKKTTTKKTEKKETVKKETKKTESKSKKEAK
jgi:large subunit ribosomal protein L24